MHIVNVMFSKGLGGIEQALVDYCEALKMKGHKVTAIISPMAAIKASLLPLGVNIIEVKNFAKWDIFAKLYIKKIMKQLSPDAVIVHGNRAVALVGSLSFIAYCRKNNDKLQAINNKLPVIGVTHNYSIKPLIGLDAVFATTNDLKEKIIKAGQPEGRVFKLPNMVRMVTEPSPTGRGRGEVGSESAALTPSLSKWERGITIGTMGRFVKKKGFDIFIRAMGDLQERGVDFKAVIGGGGEEEANLKELAVGLRLVDSLSLVVCSKKDNQINDKLQTTNHLTFLGWIKDKHEFFDNIDIFVLPSLHEPFGIILLEAFAYNKPVVTSDSEGPSEIATNGVDALIVPKNDSKAIADAVMRLWEDKGLSERMAKNAISKAAEYDISNFAALLSKALQEIVEGRK